MEKNKVHEAQAIGNGTEMKSNIASENGSTATTSSHQYSEADTPDIELVVEGKRMPCHRTVLSKSMEYFEAMFSSNMRESRQKSIELQQVAAPIMEKMIDAAYQRNIDITSVDLAQSLLSAAAMFQFKTVMKICVEYLAKHLDKLNCLEIMQLADSCGTPWLYNKAREYCLWNFSKVCQSESYLQLDIDSLCDYLGDSMLNCDSELEVFQCVVRWSAHSPEDRSQYIIQLLDVIRLPIKDKQTNLENILIKESSSIIIKIKSVLECQEEEEKSKVITKASYEPRQVPLALWMVGYEKNSNDGRDDVKSADRGSSGEDDEARELQFELEGEINRGLAVDVRLRAKRKSTQEDHSGDGETDEDDDDEIVPVKYQLLQLTPGGTPDNDHKISVIDPRPQPVETLPQGYTITVVGKDLYVCGGEVELGRNTWCMDVHHFNAETKRWRCVGQMPQARRHHTAVAWREYLYLAGGCGRHRVILDKVDRMNINTGDWEKMPKLITSVFSAVGCVCQDKLYIIKNNVQCLAMDSQQWTSLQVALPYDKGFQYCVSLGGSIYILTAYLAEFLLRLDPDSQTVATQDAPRPRCYGMTPWQNDRLVFWHYKERGSKTAVFTYNTQTGETEEWYSGNRLNVKDIMSVVKFPDFRSWKSKID